MGDEGVIATNLRLPRRPDAAFAARHAVEELASDLEDTVLSDVRLLVTELIAGRVQHPPTTAAASARRRSSAWRRP